MYPYITILGYDIMSYWVLAGLGMLVGLILILYQASEYDHSKVLILLTFLFSVYIGLSFSHFTSFLVYYPKFILKHPWRMFIFWEGGLTAYGGILGGIIGLFVATKVLNISFWGMTDLFAPSVALGFMFGRIGCFLNGCCYGIPTSLPWGVKFTNPSSVAPGGVIRHPTQLYEATGWFLIFLFLGSKRKKVLVRGNLFLMLIAGYGGLRFLVERFRADSIFIPHTPVRIAQLIGLIVVISGIYTIRVRRRNYLRYGKSKSPNSSVG